MIVSTISRECSDVFLVDPSSCVDPATRAYVLKVGTGKGQVKQLTQDQWRERPGQAPWPRKAGQE